MTTTCCLPRLLVWCITILQLTSPCKSFSTPNQKAPIPFLSTVTDVVYHLTNPPPVALQSQSLSDLANTRIPGPPGSNVEILSYVARPSSSVDDDDDKPVLVMIHEFFGMNPSIVDKAKGLAEELDCVVIAPDTFRGELTTFIPRAIWLALSTPQKRVNEDLDAVCRWAEEQQKKKKLSERGLAIMGFCYGGGKAIRYTTERKVDAATVIFYGSPLTDVDDLKNLRGPVCGIYGADDMQFPASMIDAFRDALNEVMWLSGGGNKSPLHGSEVTVFDGVGHAFWKDMEQVKRGDQPQLDAYERCVSFLRRFFDEKR